MNRFEAFMREDSQLRAETARSAYNASLVAFNSAAFTLAELDSIIATIRDELRQDSLSAEIRNAALRAMWRHRQIMRRHADSSAVFDAGDEE